MYGGFVIVLLLGGLGAIMLGTSTPGGIGTVVAASGTAALAAGLVLVGLALRDRSSSKR